MSISTHHTVSDASQRFQFDTNNRLGNGQRKRIRDDDYNYNDYNDDDRRLLTPPGNASKICMHLCITIFNSIYLFFWRDTADVRPCVCVCEFSVSARKMSCMSVLPHGVAV